MPATVTTRATLMLIAMSLVVAMILPTIYSALTENEKEDITTRGKNLYESFYNFRVRMERLKNSISPGSTDIKKPTIYTNTRTGVVAKPGRPVPAQCKTLRRMANRIGKLSLLSAKIKDAALKNDVTEKKVLDDCLKSLEELRELVENELKVQELDFKGIMVFEETLNSWKNNREAMDSCKRIIKFTDSEENWYWLTTEEDLID